MTRQRVGLDRAARWMRRPFVLECDDGSIPAVRFVDHAGVEHVHPAEPPPTTRPELYRRRAVRARLLPVFAAMPRDFFTRITEERDLKLMVTPNSLGMSPDHPDVIDERHGARGFRVHTLEGVPAGWCVRLSRVAIELQPPEAFTGSVVHECCHVDLGHDGNDATDARRVTQRREDEAVALACTLGYRRETEAMLSFWRRTFGPGLLGRLPRSRSD